MKKTVNKAMHKAAFETAHVEYEGREYRIEERGHQFVITMDQGSGFRECGKFGLWDEGFVYRNLKLAEEAKAIFESQCKKLKSI